MNPYLPHTEQEISAMLSVLGLMSVDELFRDVPQELLLQEPLDIPAGLSEYEVFSHLRALAERNNTDAVSFLGCGSYDHLIPAAVGHLVSRSEFYTAYTPYQAEMSQGLLQAIFEFQTMICQLTGLEVSNASLYDGHTAASEAGVMAFASVRKAETLLYSATLHPYTKQVLQTHFHGMGVRLIEVAQDQGMTSLADLKEKLDGSVAGVILQNPNIYGCVEDYSGFAEAIQANKSLMIVSANPLSLGLLKSPAEWGADIAIGDTQCFGLPTYFGGPTAGYIAATEKLLRKMPGRIVGQSVDGEQRRAFLLTLQAREQHIKRERATSNICSNQALAALATAVHLSCLGPQGLKQAADQNTQKAHYLLQRLTEEVGLEGLYRRSFFNEFTLVLPMPAAEVVARMAERGILAGVSLNGLDPSLDKNLLTVAVTEKRTRAELDAYVNTLKEVLS